MLDLSEVDGFGHMSTYMYICVYISFFLGCGSHLNRLYIYIYSSGSVGLVRQFA